MPKPTIYRVTVRTEQGEASKLVSADNLRHCLDLTLDEDPKFLEKEENVVKLSVRRVQSR